MHNTKQYKYDEIRLLLFLTVILVFDCDVSEDLVSQTNRNIQMKILNESMLKNHPLALQKLSEIHQKSESLQRIIQADSIIIDTDYCKYIVVDGIESYTFGIYRESPPIIQHSKRVVLGKLATAMSI